MDACMHDGWMPACMDAWINGWVDDEWVDDRWMNG
jgi:hypothetical protein